MPSKDPKKNPLNKKVKKKAEDFPTPKKKLGKKKKQETATNTTFRTKAIELPSQSILDVKEDFVNGRNLTLKDLITQLKHYSPNVRKDALVGMKDLFQKHEQVLSLHFGSILESLVEKFSDDDKDVRQTLLQLLSYMMQSSQVTETMMAPYISVFVMYLTAALTHLNLPIRLDALQYANTCINKFPLLLRNFTKELLPNYITLLSSGKPPTGSAPGIAAHHGGTASKLLNFDIKIGIFTSLRNFLRYVLGGLSTLGSPFLEKQQHLEFNWTEASKRDCMDYLPVNNRKKGQSRNNDNLTLEELHNFTSNIMPILFEAWVDCAPLEQRLVADQSTKKLDCMLIIADIIYQLFYHLQQKSADMQLCDSSIYFMPYFQDFSKYVLLYFPFSPLKQDDKLLDAFTSLNLRICNICVCFVQYADQNADWVQNIRDFVLEVLENDKRIEKSQRVGDLLYAVDRFIQFIPADRRVLWLALSEFENRCQPKSAARQNCVIVISNALMNPNLQKHLTKEITDKWMLSMPKLLWQLQDHNMETSEIILRTLLYCGKGHMQLDALQKPLVPFFFTKVTTKGEEKRVFGPFIKLSSDLQQYVIDLLYYFSSLSTGLLRSVVVCIPYLPINVATRLIEVVSLKVGLQNPAEALSFILTTLLISSSIQGTDQLNLNKKIERAEAITRCLLSSFNITSDPSFTKSLEIAFSNQLKMDDLPLDLVHAICFYIENLGVKNLNEDTVDSLAERYIDYHQQFKSLGLKCSGKLLFKHRKFFQAVLQVGLKQLTSDVNDDKVMKVIQCLPSLMNFMGPKSQERKTIVSQWCDQIRKQLEQRENNSVSFLSQFSLVEKEIGLLIGAITQQ